LSDALDFEVGDVVRATYSKDKMTVTAVGLPTPKTIECGWYDDSGDWLEVTFNPLALALIMRRAEAI
jgi:uncharacterized protein YodC (DUF2158 family)